MQIIKTFDHLSELGLSEFPASDYILDAHAESPDAIVLRSFDLHDVHIADSVKAIGRAGAGVNNIPIDTMTQRGVVVFNAPGANANAVGELTIAGMLLAARNICSAWDYARHLEGEDDAIKQKAEQGKKQFVGYEIAGKTVAVIGLGSVGVRVANAALALGMNVLGFDPMLSVKHAWTLSSHVQQVSSVEAALAHADFVTLHVPLNDQTNHLLNAERIAKTKKGAVLINLARQGIVDEAALCQALDNEQLQAYVTDFADQRVLGHERVIVLPHLGASTREAEQNCARMVVRQVRDYLENGTITNSVNFPEVVMPRAPDGYRLSIINANVRNMVGQISTALANAGLNIIDMLNKSRGEVAYTLLDVSAPVTEALRADIAAIEGVVAVRVLGNAP